MGNKKYTNVSKFETQAEATEAYRKICEKSGVTPTKEGFNKWCWEIAPECLNYRPFTLDEAMHLLGTDFKRKDGKGVMCLTAVYDTSNVVIFNTTITAKDLLEYWVFAESGLPAGVIVE